MDEVKDEIIFLESEILEDDDDAPVGTLVAPPEEAPKEEEPIAQAPAEEPQEEAPAEEPEAVEEEPQEVAEAPAEEPVEEPAPEEQPKEEPIAEEQPAEEPAPQEEPQAEEKVEEPQEEEPKEEVKPARKPRAKKEDKVTSKDSTAINIKGSDLNNELASSDFVVKQSKPATIVKSKKVKEDDVWQVAPVANKAEEEPKKEPAKKAPAKKAAPAPKAEAPKEEPKKAPAKKAEPKAAPAPAKAKSTPKSTEEKKMATKEAKPAAKPAPKKDDKPQEKVLVEGTGDPKTRAKFVIKVTDNGNYVYKLFSSNKRVVAIGAQPYPALPSCKTGIQSVIKNSGTAPIEDQTLQKPVEQKCPKWVIFLDKKGEFRLRLIASNGNIVATTNDGYLSKDAAKKGIDAIARASSNADIVRNDDLW